VSTLRSSALGNAVAAPGAARRRGTLSAAHLRLRVATHHELLDSLLARGADATNQPALAMRAAQLGSRRHRRTLARSLRRTVEEAGASRPPARATAVVTARAQILADAGDVLALAHRLDSVQPAHTTGVAIAQRLLTDALESPLYVNAGRGALGRLSRLAVETMDGAARHPSARG
jgi:hypothetical protein